MARKLWFINEINVGGTNPNRLWYVEVDGISVPVETTSASGWTVAKTGTGNYRLLSQSLEVAGFATTVEPRAVNPRVDQVFTTTAVYTPPDILHHSASISTIREYNGVFPAATWSFNFPVIAVGAGGTQDGRIGIRVFKGIRSGSAFGSVTELTTARIAGSTVLNLATGVSQITSASWAAPEVRLNNEFLIVTLAWEITGAGGNNACDVLLRYGSGSNMVSPLFKRNRQYLTDGF